MKYELQDSWTFGGPSVADGRISVTIAGYGRESHGPARDLLDRLDREVKAWQEEQENPKADSKREFNRRRWDGEVTP